MTDREREETTLDDDLRDSVWRAGVVANFDAAVERLAYARGGRKFTRDEMNER
jgi:hypothetical protein